MSSDNEFTEGELQEMEDTRNAIRDLYGNSTPVTNNAWPETTRQQFAEALRKIQPEKREAYDQALRICPQVAEKESNPERFLQAFQFNSGAAAEGIAKYWQKRLEIFQERAFLPMSLTGEGAVAKDVAEAILNGQGTVILPPDENGRAIFYVDRARLCSRCLEGDARLQIFFYMLQVMFESEEGLRNGCVVLTRIDTSGVNESTRRRNTPLGKVFSFVHSFAIPIHHRGLHIIVLQKRSFLELTVPLWLKMSERSKLTKERVAIHFSETKQHLMDDLRKYGLSEQNIPESLGGQLDYDAYFQMWSSQRLAFERAGSSEPPASAESSARSSLNQEEAECKPAAAESVQSSSVGPYEEDSDEDGERKANEHARLVGEVLKEFAKDGSTNPRSPTDKAKDRKRRLDAMYQKKKRAERKLEFHKVSEEKAALQKNNQALKQEHTFLTSLVERATEMVHLLEGTAVPGQASALNSLNQSRQPGLTPSILMSPRGDNAMIQQALFQQQQNQTDLNRYAQHQQIQRRLQEQEQIRRILQQQQPGGANLTATTAFSGPPMPYATSLLPVESFPSNLYAFGNAGMGLLSNSSPPQFANTGLGASLASTGLTMNSLGSQGLTANNNALNAWNSALLPPHLGGPFQQQQQQQQSLPAFFSSSGTSSSSLGRLGPGIDGTSATLSSNAAPSTQLRKKRHS